MRALAAPAVAPGNVLPLGAASLQLPGWGKGGRVASNRWQTPLPCFIVDVAYRLDRVWVI